MVTQTTKGVLSLISGFCMHLVLGSMYTWGSLLPYISSKLHHLNPSVTIEDTLFFIPINIFATNITMTLGGWLDKRLNQKVLLLIGTILIGGGNVICSIADSIGLYILGDLVIGFGSGIVYMTPIKNGWLYFPDNRGLVSGIIVCGFGLSSFIFAFIAKAIVNPLNQGKEPDGYYGPDVFNNVTKLFIWLGSIYSLLGITSAILFIPFKKEETISDLKQEYIAEEYITQEERKKEESQEKLGKALCSTQFLMIFLMPFLTSTYGFFTVNALKLFGSEFTINDNTLTLASSLSGLANGICRPWWGWVLDKLKFKKTYYMLCIYQLLLASTIYFTPMASEYLYVTWCFLRDRKSVV